MSAVTEVKVPRLAESISEAVLVEWLKPEGSTVRMDEPIATLETDKAAVEIAATEAGVLRHARNVGETVHVGDVLARLEPVAAGGAQAPATALPASATMTRAEPAKAADAKPAAAPAAAVPTPPTPPTPSKQPAGNAPTGPAARRLIEEHGVNPADIAGTGRGGRILKEDVERPGAASPAAPADAAPATPASPAPPAVTAPPAPARPSAAPAAPAVAASAGERIVPMTRLRQRIAERLVLAQHTAAILTTFNEIDMSAVLAARQKYKDAFEQKHGVRLGFMSFFGRACIQALREIPELNAEIRGTDMVYRDAVHLGVAVGTERGLIVPVVHNAQAMGFAAIEREIVRRAMRARDNTLSLDELVGGTFTVTNGGVYGSLLSTPILNPPQSGILGMHKIEKRPIVINDQVVVRPMMYVALSYDHRIVDGEQAVTFLVRVKEQLEAPERMLLEV